MALRELPYNLEAEESVLGACFLSKEALNTAVETLEEDSFYDAKNARIFKALTNLVDQKIPVDLTTVTSELQNKNLLEEAGGVPYLTEVVNFVPTSVNVSYYIKEVEDKAILRKLIETATNIATSGYNKEDNINETLDEAERKILSLSKNRKTSEFRSIQEVLVKTQSNLERLASSQGDVTGLPTGWYDLDKLTSGLHENEFIIIAARPAMGKTAFALNLATNVAMNTNQTVAVFTLEMGAEQIANRILSSLGQIEGYKLRTGKLLNNDWKRINEAMSQLENASLYIDDTPGISIGEIRAKCRRLSASKEGLGLVVIDYLQLISGGKNYGSNRQQEVADISRSLKTLAMELKIPIVALAQLSRAVEGREDKRPMMSDLRESGSIEQDADIVGFLYREDYYQKEKKLNDNNSISELIIGKHRNGSTATIELLFKKDTSTFLNLTKDKREEEV